MNSSKTILYAGKTIKDQSVSIPLGADRRHSDINHVQLDLFKSQYSSSQTQVSQLNTSHIGGRI